ncbi:CHAT domain-containing protein, partial [Streptomyces sp. NPDC001532]|uniref:CHAT domain-containing protein n=1 Tax=Streptomyces sp. NPDC001532 TaxID=3154520 RepID=UPI003325749A
AGGGLTWATPGRVFFAAQRSTQASSTSRPPRRRPPSSFRKQPYRTVSPSRGKPEKPDTACAITVSDSEQHGGVLRTEQLAALLARLQRIAEDGDPYGEPERQVADAAARLAEGSYEDDVRVRFELGCLLWRRHGLLPEGERAAALDLAVDVLGPCFVSGMSGLPAPLLPRLADAAAPRAFDMVRHVQGSDDPRLLSAAVELWQRIVNATPAEHSERPRALSNLGGLLGIRFQRNGTLADLDAAADLYQQAVVAAGAGHPDRAGMQFNLASVLRARFALAGAVTDLEVAVAAGQAAVDATPPGRPEWAGMVSLLGVSLLDRFEQAGALRDLDRAIEYLRRARAVSPPLGPQWVPLLTSLGQALQARFGRTGALPDADAAVKVLHDAVTAMPGHHPDRVRALVRLASALGERSQRTGSTQDLDAAMDHLRQAERLCPEGHPERGAVLSTMASASGDRFERTGALHDLDTAIALHRRAHASLPAQHPARASVLSNLGADLQRRFERTGAIEDLTEAIAAGQEAASATPDSDPDLARVLSNLAGALSRRFERSGALTDLDSAIDRLRQAVARTPADHPDRPGRLGNLGGALRRRYERTGQSADLDAAVSHLQDVVTATPPDHPHRPMWLSNLGGTFVARFERTGTTADLEAAIRTTRQAATLLTPGHPERAAVLSVLGSTLLRKHERTGAAEDLDDAIGCLEQAVTATPASHPDAARFRSMSGSAHLRKFQRTGHLKDADSAIGRLRDAMAAAPADHPDRSMWWSNLGLALGARSSRTGALTELDAAVEAGQQAVAATPADHPHRASALSNLGIALRARSERTGAEADVTAAAHCWLEASEVASAPPSVRVRAGFAASRLFARAGEAHRAADTAEAAVRLLPSVPSRRMARTDQQYAIGGFTGLAATAAALALAAPAGTPCGRAERALGLLEAGRALLLNQVLETRSDVTDLRDRHPELAARFLRLRELLDDPMDATTDPAAGYAAVDGGVRLDRLRADRNQWAEEFAELLVEIRSLDGFSSFGLPPSPQELRAEASDGPVVVFNVSDHRSDALLLTSTSITSVELPALTPAAVLRQARAFRSAQELAAHGETQAEREEAQATLSNVLRWLWDAATGPVLEALGHHRRPDEACDEEWPRVWWVPSGLLTLLPLHAAGHHTDSGENPRTVMDRVVSSYTPTVRTLRHARECARSRASTAVRSLIVAMPTTPGLPGRGRLQFVEEEAEMLRARLPQPVLLQERGATEGGANALAEPDAPTKAAVLKHLAEASLVHFACHGTSDPADPSSSRLLLHDHAEDPLTVASLIPVALKSAGLAYLSACRTAAVDTTELLDEAIHLASAFQLAGFPHVIGTLWAIDDQIAVTMAKLFYSHLDTDSTGLDPARSARALHDAVREVRDGSDLPPGFDRRQTPQLWAAYLHAGA